MPAADHCHQPSVKTSVNLPWPVVSPVDTCGYLLLCPGACQPLQTLPASPPGKLQASVCFSPPFTRCRLLAPPNMHGRHALDPSLCQRCYLPLPSAGSRCPGPLTFRCKLSTATGRLVLASSSSSMSSLVSTTSKPMCSSGTMRRCSGRMGSPAGAPGWPCCDCGLECAAEGCKRCDQFWGMGMCHAPQQTQWLMSVLSLVVQAGQYHKACFPELCGLP